MLTAQRIYDRIYRSLSGPVDQKVGGAIAIANLAGVWVMSARSWNWAMRDAVLSAVPGSERIYLPADFGQSIGVSGGILQTMEWTSWPSLIRAREDQFPLNGTYIGVVTFAEQDTGDMVPAIEVYPSIPTSGVTSIGRIAYSKAWVPLADPTDKALVPVFMEGVVLAAANAYALGYERPGDGSLEERLAMVRDGPEWAAAVQADEGLQREMGYLGEGYQSSTASWEFPADEPS